jgi:gliding motility-associated-like protein
VNSSTLILTTLPQPIANFEYSPENPAESVDEVVFRNTSLGENINKWNWFFNENGGPISKSKDASLVFEKVGSYPVAMIATNSWGCADTIVKSILVEENFSLFVPNAFSPNADGKNDIFMPKGLGILGYHLEVFDRWGEKIFVSDDLFNGWDGTFKGNLCKNEVFIWKIVVTGERGKIKNLSGHVTLNK